MASVDKALSALDRLMKDLAGEYTRAAHSGRLSQIQAHVTSVKSLISQLPDEEIREADHETRLLALHDGGNFKSEDHSSDANEKLRQALRARKGDSA